MEHKMSKIEMRTMSFAEIKLRNKVIDTENIIEDSINDMLRLQCGMDLGDHVVVSQCIDIINKHQKEYLKKHESFLSKELL